MHGPQQNLGPERPLGADLLGGWAVSSVAPRPQTLVSPGSAPLQRSPQAPKLRATPRKPGACSTRAERGAREP